MDAVAPGGDRMPLPECGSGPCEGNVDFRLQRGEEKPQPPRAAVAQRHHLRPRSRQCGQHACAEPYRPPWDHLSAQAAWEHACAGLSSGSSASQQPLARLPQPQAGLKRDRWRTGLSVWLLRWEVHFLPLMEFNFFFLPTTSHPFEWLLSTTTKKTPN